MLRQAIILAIVLITVVFVLWTTISGESFQHCISNNAEADHSYTSSQWLVQILSFTYRANVYSRCAWHVLYLFRDAITAIATVFIGLFTFTLWRSTERLAADSGKQIAVANRSARAAEMAAEAAIEAVGSDRAWMVFDTLPITGATNSILNGVPFENGVIFQVEWRNRGRSPALNSECFVDIRFIDAADNVAPAFAPSWGAERHSYPIGPNATIKSSSVLAIDNQINELQNWTTVAIIYSALRYRDTFTAVDRSSQVCLKVRYGGLEKSNNGSLLPRYEVSAFGPQNTAT
jgi:hypothetical protein